MPDVVTIDDLHVEGDISVGGVAEPADASIENKHFSTGACIQRKKMAQDTVQKFVIPLTEFRVHDNLTSLISGTSSGDDLALDDNGGAGTGSYTLTMGDVQGLTVERYARCMFYMPACYDPVETVNIRTYAGMKTTVADGSCTVDCVIHRCDRLLGVSSDLNLSAARNINSLTFGEDTFTLDVDAVSLAPGDMMDMRISISVVDAVADAVVAPHIGAIWLECDCRG